VQEHQVHRQTWAVMVEQEAFRAVLGLFIMAVQFFYNLKMGLVRGHF
jgi:hypothetical protein